MQYLSAFVLLLPSALAAQAPSFSKPAAGPLDISPNNGGPSNGSLPKPSIVTGKQFDRFIQIWIENTDFESANSTPAFANLARQGILFDQYYALTHPSEPNYAAVVGGDFWGMADDNLYNIPSNISTVVDLLEAKNISWASYQEGYPTDGYAGYNFTSANYLNSSAPPYTYYVRKHNPTIIYDSVAGVPARNALHRNFNDFAVDVNASALPQWLFVTPNLVNDAHDTTIDFAGSWLEYWLVPLLADPRFNDNRTLVLLTFDETETYTVNNRVLSILLGGAVPANLRGTTDSTYYTHYSCLSTVQANWGLGSLGRGDTNKTLSNVFSLVADVTGYENQNITGDAIPFTNATGTIPGPLNPDLYVPFSAPNMSAVGAGGGPVFVAPNLNKSLTPAAMPAPVNLTAINATVPASGPLNASASSPVESGTAGGSSNGARLVTATGVAAAVAVLGATAANAILFL